MTSVRNVQIANSKNELFFFFIKILVLVFLLSCYFTYNHDLKLNRWIRLKEFQIHGKRVVPLPKAKPIIRSPTCFLKGIPLGFQIFGT
jgi:hypothetical protein